MASAPMRTLQSVVKYSCRYLSFLSRTVELHPSSRLAFSTAAPDVAAKRPDAYLDQDRIQGASAPQAFGIETQSQPHDPLVDALLSRHIANMPASEERRVFTIARAAGANLVGQEYLHYMKEMSKRYPPLEPGAMLYPEGTLEGVQMNLLRRSNMSMPCKTNQIVYGTVYVVTKQRIWVDVGHGSLALFNLKVLNVPVGLPSPISPATYEKMFKLNALFKWCAFGTIWPPCLLPKPAHEGRRPSTGAKLLQNSASFT
jgi:hypothetical protein